MKNNMPLPPEKDALWESLGKMRASDIVEETLRYVDRIERRRRFWQNIWGNPHSVFVARAAAACLLIVILGHVLWPNGATSFQTRIGEVRTVALSDGTNVTLDSNTRIRVDLSGKYRKVELLAGRAHFDVGHDAAKPFKVFFDGSMVTALGTSFDVSIPPLPTAVTLLEGKVVVQAADGSQSWMKPGERAVQAGNGSFRSKDIDLEFARSWLDRRIEFRNATLHDALTEINSYSLAKIVVELPDQADRKLSGTFKAGDTESAIKALCTYFSLRVSSRSTEKIILSPAKNSEV